MSVAQHGLDHQQVMPSLCLGARLFQDTGDRPDQLSLVERLHNMRSSTRRECAFDEVAAGVAGQGDDRHVALAQDLASRLDPVDPRQGQVDQDQVGPVSAGELDCFDSVAGVRAHLEACVFEDETKIGANDRVVVDGEHASCRKGWQGQPPVSGTKKDLRRFARGLRRP